MLHYGKLLFDPVILGKAWVSKPEDDAKSGCRSSPGWLEDLEVITAWRSGREVGTENRSVFKGFASVTAIHR